MKLVRDPRSFQAPLDEAWAASVRAAIAAGVVVHGAEARIRAALDERDALLRFVARIGELLRSEAFIDLPRQRRGTQIVPYCHHLTVGPWRGVFLVDPAGELVVALLFSKAPHRLDERLGELVLQYPFQTGEIG